VQQHHKKTIENLIHHFKDDKRFPAMIIAGSVAKGCQEDNSDVDFMLIATDQEFKQRQKNVQLHVTADQLCEPPTYSDGKVINLQFLIDVADHGSEPARAAFADAFIGYSRIPDTENILKQIPVYQIHEQKEKMISFYSQVVVQHWYIGEAEKRKDTYLIQRSAVELVLFAGRLILAHNKILYPYHKWFMRQLDNAPDKPDDFMELVRVLLKDPCKKNADLLTECLYNFRDWPKPPHGNDGVCARFFEDSECNWKNGIAPVCDR
jgi:predicted nucleotidyltransferase